MPANVPGEPTARQLLITAQGIAAGLAPSIAAGLACLDAGLARAPGLAPMIADCRAQEARPRQEQDELLQRLLRHAVQRGLADGKAWAVHAAIRLVTPMPEEAPAPAPAPGKAAPARASGSGRKKKEEEPPPAQPEVDPASVRALWGMRPDHEGDWEWDDGRLVMPDRDLYVVPGPKGPIRLIDITPEEANPDLLATLDAMSSEEAQAFNRMAFPTGGLQWDTHTRTLWLWEGPPPRPRPKAVQRADARTPKPELAPARSPHVALRARLERLLAQPAPRTPDELDLAEAVCAQLWPNWPRYSGGIDGFVLRDVLAARPLDPVELKRLAGCRGPAPRAGPA